MLNRIISFFMPIELVQRVEGKTYTTNEWMNNGKGQIEPATYYKKSWGDRTFTKISKINFVCHLKIWKKETISKDYTVTDYLDVSLMRKKSGATYWAINLTKAAIYVALAAVIWKFAVMRNVEHNIHTQPSQPNWDFWRN